MYTSAIECNKQQALKLALNYGLVTLLTVALGWIYERFSHGVYSDHTIYSFIFPLTGGVLFWLVAGTIEKSFYVNKLFLNMQAASIATLTLGFIVKGVLDIYGTSSSLVDVYWVVGGLLAMAAIITLVRINSPVKR